MLNIHNLYKILGREIPISKTGIQNGTIEDVIQQMGSDGCSYIFKVQVYEPQNPNLMSIGMYEIKLDRKRIEYPRLLNHCWEISYEEKPNQFIVEALDKDMVSDMYMFMMKLGDIMDRILNK
jgi:hypothetical protein